MFSNGPRPKNQNGPLSRKDFRRIMNAIARANAPGKEGRIEAAAAKRSRRDAKRARDAGYTQSAGLV